MPGADDGGSTNSWGCPRAPGALGCLRGIVCFFAGDGQMWGAEARVDGVMGPNSYVRHVRNVYSVFLLRCTISLCGANTLSDQTFGVDGLAIAVNARERHLLMWVRSDRRVYVLLPSSLSLGNKVVNAKPRNQSGRLTLPCL